MYTLLGGVTFFFMRLRLRTSTTPARTCLVTLGLFVFLGSVLVGIVGSFGNIGPFSALAGIVHAEDSGDSSSGKLITVYDRGQSTTFVTDKDTLKEAFQDAGIAIDAKDAVEPSLDEKLVASSYSVNIYRARPVIVVDGLLRTKIITPYQSSERIVKDAGITLDPEDTTSLTRSADIISDGAGLLLVIDRATPLELDLYGQTNTVKTQASTVGELLKEKNITLGPDDRISLPANTPITSGMQLRVWREGHQTITVDEAVDFKVQQIQDADQLVGYKQVQTKGVDGKRTVTYQIEIQNGREVDRQEIASITTLEPTTQVEIIGTKPIGLPYTGSGTKTEWLEASNITPADWGYADYMVMHESSWNPNAVNPYSGACGLAQALPCSKVAGNPYDPINSLNWMNAYVLGRYGSWQNAYNFWHAHNWY